jgi:type IV secretion system protein VirD4
MKQTLKLKPKNKPKPQKNKSKKTRKIEELIPDFIDFTDVVSATPKTLTVVLRDVLTGERLTDNDGYLMTAEIDKNLILTDDVRMSLNTRHHGENLNVLVIGGSGSGKTRFYVKPNIMQLNTSYVITDPKGEILRATGKLLEQAGYELKVFNLIDMTNSFNYNPFAYVYNMKGELVSEYVIKMVNCLMKNTKEPGSSGGDKFWEDSTTALISALSFYLLETDPEKANFAEVMKLMKLAKVNEQNPDEKSELDLLFDKLQSEKGMTMGVKYYTDFKQAAGETAKSILISVAVRLQAFNLPQVTNLMHTDTLSLDTIGDKKTALFVIIPVSDSTFNFIVAMMYTQLFDNLFDIAENKYGGRLPIHVRCMLDEFANIGVIPDFDKLIAFMRSKEISVNIILQTLSQLKTMYKESNETIIGNCDSMLFLGGQEPTTVEMISKKLGKETIDSQSHNRSKGKQSSTSEQNAILGRELLTPDELTVMPTDECVLIVKAKHPFYGRKFQIENHPNYCCLEDFDKKNVYDYSKISTKKIGDIDIENTLNSERIAPDDTSNYDDISIEINGGTKVPPLIFNTENNEKEEQEGMNTAEEMPDMSDEETDFGIGKIFGTAEPATLESGEEIFSPNMD